MTEMPLSTIRAMRQHLDRACGILCAHELWEPAARIQQNLADQRKWHGLDFGDDPAERGQAE